MGSINPNDSKSLDSEIIKLQKSTRTTVPAMLPLHDILRHKYKWYYNWSLWKWSKALHIVALLLFLGFLGNTFYQIGFSQPKQAMAATTLANKDTSGVYKLKPGETEVVEERTASFKKFAEPDGKTFRVAGQVGPIHYKRDPFDAKEQFKEIDLTIQAVRKNWDYEMESNGYQVHIWNNRKINENQSKYVARFLRAGKWLEMAPVKLVWENNKGERQLISKVKNAGNPVIDNSNYTITWEDVFGKDIDFRYNVGSTKFFKTVIVNDKNALPEPAIDRTGLKLTVVMAVSWDDSTEAANGFGDEVSTDELGSDLPEIIKSTPTPTSVSPSPQADLRPSGEATPNVLPSPVISSQISPSPEVFIYNLIHQAKAAEEIPNESGVITQETPVDEEKENPGEFSYKDGGNRDLWWMQEPKAWDSSEEVKETKLEYSLKREGESVFMDLAYPGVELSNIKYPLYIDTAISEEQVGASADDAGNWGSVAPGNGNFQAAVDNSGFGYTNVPSSVYRMFGMRFQTVPIPRNATINSASVSLSAHLTGTNTLYVVIAGEDVDDMAAFADTTHEPYDSYVARTTATVDYTGSQAWTAGTFYQGPDIATIVAEITSRAGWNSNQDLGFVYYTVTATNGQKFARTYDYAGNVSGPKFNATFDTVPTAPTIQNGSALSTSSIRWAWTDNSSNESGFRVQDSSHTNKCTSGANTTTCDEGSLAVNTQYTRHVHAWNVAGESTASGNASRYTLANVPNVLPTVDGATVNSLNVTVNDTQPANNPAITTYAVKVTYGATTKYVQSATNTLGDSADWQLLSTWGGARTITGLAASTTYSFFTAGRNGDGIATAYTTPAVEGTTTAAGITVSGTSNGSGTVKVAVNGTLDPTQTGGVIAAGSWTVENVGQPTAGQVITAWIDGVADASESTAVTKYVSGNVSGMVLNTNVLTVGSADNQSLTAANVGAYTCSNDEDVMQSLETTVLTVNGTDAGCGANPANAYSASTINILASNTLTIGATETLTAHHVTIAGALTGTTTATFSVSGNWTTSGTFTAGTSTVTFAGTAQSIAGATTFYHLVVASSTQLDITSVTITANDVTVNGTKKLRLDNALDKIMVTSLVSGQIYGLKNDGTIQMTAGETEVTYTLQNSAGATFDMDGGTLDVDDATSSEGVYNYGIFDISGGTSELVMSFNNWNGGTATFSGGTHTFGQYLYNREDNESNQVNISGGTINAVSVPNWKGKIIHTAGILQTTSATGYVLAKNYPDTYYHGSGTAKVITTRIGGHSANTNYYNDVEIINAGYIDPSATFFTGTLDVNGDFTITGSLDANSKDISVAGNWINNGTYTEPATLTMDGTGKSISGTTTFNNLTIAASEIATAANLTIIGALTVNGSSGITASSGTATMNNGSSIANSGTLNFSALSIANGATVTTSSSFTIGNGITVGDASSNLSPSGGTVTMAGGAITNNGTLVFNNLTSTGTVSGATSFNVANDFLVSAGTFTGTVGKTITISGNLDFTGGALNSTGIFTIVMNGADKNLIANNQTFRNLQISNNITVTTSNANVNGTLTVDDGKTLTINTGRQFSMASGSTTTLAAGAPGGTITSNSTGYMVFWDTAGGNLSKDTGVFSANAIFAASGTNAVVPARAYGGYLRLQGYASDRTITIGTATDVNPEISATSYFQVRATGAGNLNVDAGTYDPVVTAASFSFVKSSTGTPTITMGDDDWNIAGDVNFTNGTVIADGSTLNLTGVGGSTQVVTPNGQTLNNLEIPNNGGRTIQFAGSSTLNVSGTWTVTGASGQLINLISTNTNQWTINPTAASVSYASIERSNNTGVTFCATNSLTGANGNNTGWNISSTASCVPVAPTGVTIGPEIATDGFTVHWTDNSSNETGFKVWISTVANADCSLATYNAEPDFTTGPGATSQAVGSKSVNTRYCAKVAAANGTFGDSGAAYSSPKYTLIQTPTGITFGTIQNNSIAMSANGGPFTNLGTGSSTLVFSETSGNPGGGGAELTVTANSATDAGLSVNIQYGYTVHATNGDGTPTAETDPAATKYTLANDPAAPTLSAGTPAATAMGVVINAGGNSAATEFAIYNSTTSQYVQADGTLGVGAVWQTKAIWNPADSPVNVTGLAGCNTSYTFRTQAKNGDGVLAPANIGDALSSTRSTGACAPTVTVQAASNNNTGTSITFNGNITATGGENATVRGFKYSVGGTCTDATTVSDAGSFGTGAFSKASGVLTVGTQYSVRAFAANGAGTSYSDCAQITTPTIPTVTVAAASGISSVAATLNGNITDTGIGDPASGVIVTERGFNVYNNENCSGAPLQNPHENDYVTGYSTGAFSIATTDALSAHTNYWYKAYAINSSSETAGVSGACQAFTTIDTTITMSVQAASGISATGATLNGTIESIAEGPNTSERGFKFYTDSQICGGSPTDVKQNGSYGAGAYTLGAGVLTPNTYYSYKSYALNSADVAELSPTCEPFLTLAAVPDAFTVATESWDGTGNKVTITPNSNGNPAATSFYIQAKEIAYDDAAPQATCDNEVGWFALTGGDGWAARTNGVSFADYRTADKYVCYRAKAKNQAAAETAYSSTSVVALTAPAQPSFEATVATYAPTVTTTSITWDWNNNTLAPDGYRLYNSATDAEVCGAGASSGCTQTQSGPGSDLQPNVSYSVKAEAYRGALKGQPSVVRSAYTAIEPITSVSLTDRTTSSISTDSLETPSNLTAGSSGLQYCYFHLTQADVEESLGCNAWKQNANAEVKGSLNVNDKYKVTVQSRNGDSRTSGDPVALTRYTLANPPITAGHDDTALTTNTIKWTWGDNSNPAWTEYCVGDDSHCSATTSQTYTDPAWTANSYHALNIYAKNGNAATPAGERVDTSAINDGRYTAIETPTTITAGLITPNSIQINMTDSLSNLNVGSSGIQFAETSGNPNGGGEAAFTTWAQTTTTTDVNLKGAVSGDVGTTYTYKVKARNADGVDLAQFSPEFEFTTTAGTQLLFQLPGETLDESGANLLSYSDPNPSAVTAGVPFDITIKAADGANYRDLAHADTITLSSSDVAAELPVAAAMTAGDITYNNVILKTVGPQTISGTGSAGSSHEVMVVAGICSATVSTAVPASQTLYTGETATITVNLKDAFGNVLAGHGVSAASDQAGDNITFSAATTDVNGRVLIYVTSAAAHSSTITITDTTDVVTLNTHPQITFDEPIVTVENPTNFGVSAGDRQVVLNWTNPAAFDHINIYRSLVSGSLGVNIEETASATFTDTGLNNGTTYYYTLKAEDAANNLSSGTTQLSATPQATPTPTPTPLETVSPTPPPDDQAPSIPTNLRATSITDSSITFVWDASTDDVGVAGYEVYNADTRVLIGQVGTPRFNTNGLSPETLYNFFVRAFDTAGNYSDFSAVLSITTEVDDPNDADDDEEGAVAFLVMGNVPKEVDADKKFPTEIRVTAADAGGSVNSGYDKAVFFSSTDSEAKLKHDQKDPYTFNTRDAGVHSFKDSDFVLSTAGKQKLTVTDNSSSSTAEIMVLSSGVINDSVQKAGEEIRDFFSNRKNVENLNTGVVTATTALLLTPLIINTLMGLSSLLPQLTIWFYSLLQALGIRKRRKDWGVIFNSQTGQAVPLAVIRIYDKRYNRVLEQSVADQQGRYGFLVKDGTYFIKVAKAGFTFPSVGKNSTFYEKIYNGGEFKIAGADQSIAFNIPLDPHTKSGLAISIWVGIVKVSKLLQKLVLPFFFVGLVVNIVILIMYYNTFYILTLIFYCLIGLMQYLRTKKSRPYGKVTDVFNKPIAMAIVRIYHKSNNRLVETDVTDKDGRFKFLVTPGVYYILATKPGYTDFKSHLMYLQKEQSLVTTTIKLKKE